MDPTTAADPAGRDDLMDPDTRDRLLALLAAVGRELPSMRLGQLVCALTSAADAAVPGSMYDIEDAELLAAAEAQLAFLRANR